MQFPHIFIPVCFGQNTCSSNAGIFAISFDNTMVWDIGIICKPIAINQQELRLLDVIEQLPGALL